MPDQPYVDEEGRPTPYVVWAWKHDNRHSSLQYRAVRRGRATDNFVIECRTSDDRDAMNQPVWRCITDEDAVEGFKDLLAAMRAFLWHLRQTGAEADYVTGKPAPTHPPGKSN